MVDPEDLAALVKKYDAWCQREIGEEYTRVHFRQEFIDPFFYLLGWGSRTDPSQEYLKVIKDTPVRIRGISHTIDYSFVANGKTQYIAIQCNPEKGLIEDSEKIQIIRSYVWNAGIPLIVITSFGEFAIYDGTILPRDNDDLSVGRIATLTSDQYAGNWEWLFSHISTKRYLNNFSVSGTIGCSETFQSDTTCTLISELEWIRDILARNIVLENPSLHTKDLNFILCQVSSLLFFFRVLEDRGLERYGTLLDLGEGNNVNENLWNFFQGIDRKYGLNFFTCHNDIEEKDLSKKISSFILIDDEIIRKITKRMYSPASPFLFSVLPLNILAESFDQFLKMTVVHTGSSRLLVRHRPDIKDTGIPFRVPENIIKYIARQTLATLTLAKNLDEISSLRILDPCCGSGRVLLCIYQHLINQYVENCLEPGMNKLEEPDTASDGSGSDITPQPDLCLVNGTGTNYHPGQGRRIIGSALSEKNRILKNCIFGVDPDPRSVMITRVILLLETLHGENAEDFVGIDVSYLCKNIRSGNVLIGTDYFSSGQTYPYNYREKKRINPFDWYIEFSEIMQAGGFDLVIGIPPFLQQHVQKRVQEYLQTNYSVYSDTSDLSPCYIERGIMLLKPGGCYCALISDKWMRARYGEPLRRFLKNLQIEEIITLEYLSFLSSVDIHPTILFISKNAPIHSFFVSRLNERDFSCFEYYQKQNRISVDPGTLGSGGWTFFSALRRHLQEKIQKAGRPLEEYVSHQLYRGLKIESGKALIINEETRSRLIEKDKMVHTHISPIFSANDIRRYSMNGVNTCSLCVKSSQPGQNNSVLTDIVGNNQQEWNHGPVVSEDLTVHSQYSCISDFNIFNKPKIVVSVTETSISCIFDKRGLLFGDDAIIIPVDDLYLLGVLNSTLIWWMYVKNKDKNIFRIPVYTPDFDDPDDIACHNAIISLVTKMLEMNAALQDLDTCRENDLIREQIEMIDAQIDTLVYKIYCLTPEEIAILGQDPL